LYLATQIVPKSPEVTSKEPFLFQANYFKFL
jgi:hypothetical protein